MKERMMTKNEVTDVNVEILRQRGMVMRSTWLCMAKNIGFHGNVFGGDLMSHVDEVAAAFAAEICDTPMMVTRSLNAEFLVPMKVGNVVKTYCGIESIGNTSLTIIVEMRKYNVRSEAEVVCLRVNTTFVRIDEEGSATPIYRDVKEKYDTLVKNNK